MEENNQRKKRFKLFDSQREGKGVTKEEAALPPKLKKFFILFKRDFSRLISVNMFMVIGNFPLLFLIIALSGALSFDYAKPVLDSFPALAGIMECEDLSASLLTLNGIIGPQTMGNTFQPIAYIFIGLSFLTLLTWGCVCVGTTYIMRNMVKGDPVFLWSDFWYAIKRNFKQAFWFGILDLIILVLIPVNIYILGQNSGYFNGIVFWLNIVFGFLYFIMRPYIYIQMVTFALSVRKILKNALIFSIIGFKRNFMAILGMLCILAIDFVIIYSGILMPVGLMLPLIMLFADVAYMFVYASYFKIKDIMIDPYSEESSEEVVETADGI